MSRRYGPAIHSESAFNEETAVRFLEEILESRKRIKTFFKSNDRTPNYDGSFEIIEGKGIPKKQFIVQIKKTKALRKSKSGLHKGYYRYEAETSFLYYVKNKVTENPAIYFVVDIDNKIAYYIYLSDKLLSELNFENKDKISFWFNDSNILNEERFYREMSYITNERNEHFFMGPMENYADLQDAVYKLNTLLDTDFKRIKEAVLPELYRFGIATSSGSETEISVLDKNNKQRGIIKEKSVIYGLYPQNRGTPDTGIRDFRGMENYYTSINIGGSKSPDEYINDVIHKIVKSFCENPPIELLPTKVLMEIVYDRHNKLCDLLNVPSGDVSDALENYYYLLDYLFRMLTANDLSDSENEVRNKYINNGRIREHSIDFGSPEWIDIKAEINAYIEKVKPKQNHKINVDLVLNVITKECIQYYMVLSELKRRGITTIEEVWKYDIYDIFKGNEKSTKLIETIIEQWFDELPDIYAEFYKNVFDTPKYEYQINGIYSFDVKDYSMPFNMIGITAKLYEPSEGIKLTKSDIPLTTDFTEEDRKLGIKSIISSLEPAEMVRDSNKKLFYDGIRCWLYQGICNTLRIKPEGIHIGWRNATLF